MVPHGHDTVTVLRAPVASVRGSDVRDWDNAEPHDIDGCNIQPSSTSREFGDRAESVDDRWRLFAPWGADIEPGDRIGYDGHLFEIDGSPMPRKSPTGRVSHVECALVEWRG